MPVPKLPFWLNLNTLAAAIIAALLVYVGLQKVELLTCRLHNKDYQHQLNQISTAKNNQKIVTRERIVESERGSREADRVAEKIETAPVPGLCATKPQVLQADL
jgi:hypothetical protein